MSNSIFIKRTAKGSIVEAHLLGKNPNRPDESIYVNFKKETSGKFTVEIHSHSKNGAGDMAWDKNNNPWSEKQMLFAELYGFYPSWANVLRSKTDFGTDLDRAIDNKFKAIELAKKLVKEKYHK